MNNDFLIRSAVTDQQLALLGAQNARNHDGIGITTNFHLQNNYLQYTGSVLFYSARAVPVHGAAGKRAVSSAAGKLIQDK